MDDSYDAVKSALKELVAQGIFDPNQALKEGLRDLVAMGLFNPDDALKDAELARLRAEVREKYDLGFEMATKQVLSACKAENDALRAAADKLRQERDAFKARVREFDKSIDAEMRDPNGTIWEVANDFLKRAEAAESRAKVLLDDMTGLAYDNAKMKGLLTEAASKAARFDDEARQRQQQFERAIKAEKDVDELKQDARLRLMPYDQLQFPTRQRMREEIAARGEALAGFLAYFKSGNSVPVEKATIRADSPTVLKAIALTAAHVMTAEKKPKCSECDDKGLVNYSGLGEVRCPGPEIGKNNYIGCQRPNAKPCRCQRVEENGHYLEDCPRYEVCVEHKKGNSGPCSIKPAPKHKCEGNPCWKCMGDAAKPTPGQGEK